MAKKKEVIEEIESHEIIIQDPIESVLSNGFGRYSKYVLQERAVPDVRDGLKPVQRRIIYAMFVEGNVSNKPTRKCARTVGNVIGKYHPHGDTSVYEAMVRLSQDWKMRVPLIDFQGNNGSIDGDGAAAYRYTEARLAEITDQMVLDLNKDTVDMELNFDDQEYEPTVLPSRFPNVLVNGASGVAIGASTDIPPHNLGEVIDATIYRINHKRCTSKDLMQFVKAPDFPTGGIIINPEDLENIYQTGKGVVRVLCKTHIEEDKSCNHIVITEIPYGVDKSSLVQNIAKCRVNNNIDAILDIRDETDKDGLRICIDVKKEADAEATKKFIISKGVLTSTIKFNMLVINHYRPSVLSLLQVIDCYIEHQIDVIARRSNFDLKKYRDRLHIVEGLIKALSILDKIIALIRSSTDKGNARSRLMNEFGFTERQAEALLNMQLYRLSNTDVTTLVNEGESLKASIKDLNELLSSEDKMNRLICKDLKTIKDKYADPRRTDFQQGELDLKVDMKDLVTKDETMICFTRDGYLKRTSMRSYNSVSDSMPGLKDGDVIRGIAKCYTTDNLLLFTTLGNFLSIPVYKLFDNKWKEEGKHINEIGSVSNAEKIIGGILVSEFKEGANVILISKNGQIKRTAINEFETPRIAKTSKCFNLSNNDELVGVGLTLGNSDILVTNSLGQASLFNEQDINLVSLKAGGIKSMTGLNEDIYISSLLTFSDKENCKLGIITAQQGARLVDYTNITKTSRMGPKTALYKSFKSEPQICLNIFKFARKQEKMWVNVILSNRIRDIVKLEQTKTFPLEAYLKRNLELASNDPIVDTCIETVPVLNEDSKIFIVKKIEKEEKPSSDEYEQLSLFSYIDDDD